jgi:DNA repair protein SbcD/Mre11
VAPHTWYSGSLEYIGLNIWGQLAEEVEQGFRGKGWLLADLDRGTVTRESVPAARPVIDLEPVRGEGLGADALNKLIEERLRAIPGGVTDRIVRLRVYDVPRHVARELDHSAIRAYKSEALHLNLDIRRPEIHRVVGVGAPGKRQTLPELVREYLRGRPLPAELDREEFVRLGEELMDSVERDLAGT